MMSKEGGCNTENFAMILFICTKSSLLPFPVTGPLRAEAWRPRRPYLLSQCFILDCLRLNECSREKSASNSTIVWFNLPHSPKAFTFVSLTDGRSTKCT